MVIYWIASVVVVFVVLGALCAFGVDDDDWGDS